MDALVAVTVAVSVEAVVVVGWVVDYPQEMRNDPLDTGNSGKRPHRPPWTLAGAVDRRRNDNWEEVEDDMVRSYLEAD